MVPIDPDPSPSDIAHAASESHPAPAGEKLFSEHQGRLLIFALAAALIAGAGSLLAGEAVLNFYHSDPLPPQRTVPSREEISRLKAVQLYKATLTFATQAGFFGLMMGLAGGLARRSILTGAQAAILGLVLGTAVVASLAWLLVPVFYKRYDPQVGNLALPLLTHGALWSATGAIGGLAFGVGLGRQGRWNATLVGGLVGAAAATVVYEFAGALAFASSKTDMPVSSSIETRAMAHLLVVILSAVGAVWALNFFAQKKTKELLTK